MQAAPTKPRPASAIVQRSQTLPAQAALPPKRNAKKKAAPAPPSVKAQAPKPGEFDMYFFTFRKA